MLTSDSDEESAWFVSLGAEAAHRETRFSSIGLSDGTGPVVYKTEAVASLSQSHSSRPLEAVQVVGCQSESLLCLAVGTSTFLFDDADQSQTQTHKATISLQTEATHSAFNFDASFLAVGDKSGLVHFIHVESCLVALSLDLKALLQAEGLERGWGIKLVGFVHSDELVLVLESLVLLRFSNINFSRLEQAIASNDTDLGAQAQASISIEVLNLSKESNGCIQDIVSILPWRGDFSSTSALLILLNKYTSNRVSDLMILPSQSLMPKNSQNSARFNSFNILTLLAPDASDSGSRCIQVISLPTNTVTHSVEVLADCWLIQRGPISHAMEDGRDKNKPASEKLRMYFAERESTSAENPMRINIYSLSETDPSHKIRSLIEMDKFGEAVQFSEQFGLDMQLSNAIKSQLVSVENIEAILKDLDQIEDEVFCLRLCLDAALGSHKVTHLLLSYARGRHVKESSSSYLMTEDLKVSVQQAIHRLGTFQTLSLHDGIRRGDPSIINSTSDNSLSSALSPCGLAFDGSLWQSFRTANLVDVLQDRISRGDLKSVVFMWRRHCADDGLMDHLMIILNSLPEAASVRELISWLEVDIIPNIVSIDLFIALAEWIQLRAHVIEANQSRPHEALTLISLLDSSKKSSTKAKGKSFEAVKPVTPGYYVQNTISFAQKSEISTFGFNAWSGKDDFLKLKSHLEDLVYLWDVMDFKVVLSEYHQSSPSSIALDLLDRVAAYELLPDAIAHHFRPYAVRHHLDFDSLLKEYCLEVMDKSVSMGKILAGGPWETRVLAISNFFSNTSIKSSILLELMYRTPIPWSDKIETEIIEALKDTSLIQYQEIVEQYRLMRLKRTLLNHGAGHFNISDVSKSKALLMFLLGKLDSASAMKEAMQIVSIYPQVSKLDAYIIRLQNLLEGGELDRGLLLLKTGYEYTKAELPQDATQSEVDKQLDIELALDLGDILTVGGEIMSWLLEVMECAVTEEEKDGKECFTWSVTAAIQLSCLIQSVKTDFNEEFRNQTVPKSSIHGVQQQNLIASHLAALEMSNSICSVETVKALKNLKELSFEFDIRISLAVYRHDEVARRVVLNRFAKEVFKYGPEPRKGTSTPTSLTAEFSRTELYRLAELLGFERCSLDGIIAEEAARNGDVKTALLLCKELFEKSPDAITAETLKNISLLLTSYAAENKEVFKDLKESRTNFRLTKWIMELSQKALATCGEELIGDCLDDFKNYEILHAVFTQCDAGDYGTLLSSNHEKRFPEGPGSSTSNPSTSPSIACTSSFPVKWSLSTKLSDRSLDLDVASIGDNFGASLFDEHYHEGGLVLPTEKAMGLATEYVLDLASAVTRQAEADKQERIGGTAAALASPAKGKGQELAVYLKSNRVLIAALKMWHRSIELRIRSTGTLRERILSEEVLDEDSRGHIQLVRNLAENVFSSRFIDQNLAFGSLLTIPTETAFEVFKIGMSTTGKDYDRLLKFSAVGAATGMAWNQRSFQISCQDMAKNARWWHQFNLLNIPVETDMFKNNSNSDYQRTVIPMLLNKTGMDILTALEFARTYKIEDDFVIFEYVKQLLLNDSDSQEYKYRVAGIIDDIANKPLMISLLNQVVAGCSPYDYERVSFVYNQILRLDSEDQDARKGLRVLEILSNYTRRIPPNAAEFEAIKGYHGVLSFFVSILRIFGLLGMHQIYPMSATCLPFHSVIKTGWKCIQPEIHESTVSRLLPLSVPLNILADDFYGSVVEGFIARLTSDQPTRQAPIPFADVKTFLTKMQDTRAAAKKAVLVAEAYSTGLDRISAFKQALVLSKRLVESMNETTPADQIEKFNQYHESIAFALVAAETDYQLECHGLDEYSEWSGYPEQLVEELYRTKSKDALTSDGALDLHSIVDEIGERYGLNVESIRNRLLQTGLLQDAIVTSEEKDLYLPSMRVQINNLLNSDHERALQLQLLYIARSVPVQLGMQFFLMGAYNPTSKIQTLHRIRSLSLLFQLAGPEDFEEAGKSYDEIRGYMQMLLYLIDFEELRIVQSIKEFQDCDKESLARSLWLNHGGEPKVVQLICNLSLDYGILDLTLWENALKRLVKLGAVRYLAGIIESVAAVPELAQMTFLPAIWNRMLILCLDEVSDKKDQALYERMLVLIQKCPFAYDLDIVGLVEKICILKFGNDQGNANNESDIEKTTYLILKGLSFFPPHEAVFAGLKQVTISAPSLCLLNALSQPSEDEVAGAIGGIEYLRVQVYASIHHRRDYSVFEKNALEGHKFLQYLMAIGETDALVGELRSRGREKEADEIVARVQEAESVF
ncbi:rough deal protein C-terminal region-domain-containing protein [Obelidium mucronatum]|nr:rough deal protein C-terminal region-domain-containing protein [Obelidium mucronatum]